MHLSKHRPQVGSRMTLSRVTTDYQRHAPAKPSNANPEELSVLCFFKINKTCKEIFAILPRFLEDLLQSEDLVRGAATRTKTALALLQFFSSPISRLLAFTFPGKLRSDLPL